MTTTPPQTAPRRIAIIGGGIAGLSAAYDLTKPGAAPAQVTVFEAGPVLGGLAAGFKGRPTWDWPLEHFYHHLFTNDDAIIGLTAELGLSDSAGNPPAQHGHPLPGRRLPVGQPPLRAQIPPHPVHRPPAHGHGDRLSALSPPQALAKVRQTAGGPMDAQMDGPGRLRDHLAAHASGQVWAAL